MKMAVGSLVVGLVVMALKVLAWWLTDSIALLSDALESLVNVAAAIAMIAALRVAAIPADSNHPYGHHKAEFFSAVLEGVLIVLAALFILREAWGGFQAPGAIAEPGLGLLINAGAGLMNGAWAWLLIRQGRKHKSPALVADGRHLMADLISTVGVLAGISLAVLTGWWILDPALAVLVALNILWSGWMVIRSSLSGLMDESVSDEELDRVRDIISAEATGAVEAHDLRTRHAGGATFIDFHLVVPGDLSVHEAHEMCDRVEAALIRKMPGARVTIHVEPEHKAKHNGIVVLD